MLLLVGCWAEGGVFYQKKEDIEGAVFEKKIKF